jgi:hypothetical protein
METARVAGKMHAGASRLRIIGLVLIVFAFALFVYFTRKQEQHIEVQKTEIVTKDAVIDQKVEALEKVAVVQNRENDLAEIVTQYLGYRDKHDVDSLDALYADKLERYMKFLTNCSKAEVMKADKKYWTENPKDSFTMAGTPAITINDDGTAKAIVNGRNCRNPTTCVDQLMQINFDTENKINYVRGYLANG